MDGLGSTRLLTRRSWSHYEQSHCYNFNLRTDADLKDTGTKNQAPLSFVMLNYFRTNQHEEP